MNHVDDIDNMKKCVDVFGDYMYKLFNVDVYEAFPETNPRRLLYECIQNVKVNPQNRHLPLKTLNNICLNTMRDFYIKKHNLVASKKPNQRSLDREQQVYGKRQVNTESMPIPINTTIEEDKSLTELRFQQMMQSRDPQSPNEKQMQLPMSQISDAKLNPDDFQKQYQQLQQQRENISIIEEGQNNYHEQSRFIQQQQMQNQPYDPQMFQQSLSRQVEPENNDKLDSDSPDQNIINKTNYAKFHSKPVPYFNNSNLKTLQEQPTQLYISPYNYITINGYDRDWLRQKSRFNFTIEMNEMSKTYKNICELTFTKLIIPSEIVNERSITNPIPKTHFVHNYSLNVPYLILQIDEINDVCDGLNQVNKKAFVHFVQDACYHCENGRGYTIMKPLQDEKKVFHPTPLASLPRLTISITKPNGSLFNQALDKYHVWKVEYVDYNRQYLKIVLDKSFDKNEFSKGDTVYIKKFKMPYFEEESEDLEEDPAYQNYIENSYSYNRIMEFINRPEGHDILESGKTNSDGFHRYFMIQAPGEFDADNGRFVIDKKMVDLIKKHNELNFPQSATPSSLGHIINITLQPIISMQIKTAMGNANTVITPNIV